MQYFFSFFCVKCVCVCVCVDVCVCVCACRLTCMCSFFLLFKSHDPVDLLRCSIFFLAFYMLNSDTQIQFSVLLKITLVILEIKKKKEKLTIKKKYF